MREAELFNFILRKDADFDETVSLILDGISNIFMHLGYGINTQFKSNMKQVLEESPSKVSLYFRKQAEEMKEHYASVLESLRQRSVSYDVRKAKEHLKGAAFIAGRLNDYVNNAAEELGIRQPAEGEKPESALVYYGIGMTRDPKALVSTAVNATRLVVMVEPVYQDNGEMHALLFFNWFDMHLRGDKPDNVCFNILDDKTIKGYIGAENLKSERDLGKNALMPVNRKMYVVEKGCIVPYQGFQPDAQNKPK